MRNKTLYEILNVSKTASQKEIQASYLLIKYHTLKKQYPSDIIDNELENLKLINFAYWTLKDEARRRAYDLMLKVESIPEEASTNDDLEFSGELSIFRTKIISLLSLKRLWVSLLMISVFLFCFYGDVSSMENVINRDIIFATSIFLYFLSLLSIMQML